MTLNSSLPPWCSSLYPSQAQVIDYFVDQFSNGARVGLLDSPTGCLSGDTLIRLNRGGKGYKTPLRRLVLSFNGHRMAPRAWDLSIPTRVQCADGDHIRLGLLGDAIESGIKETHLLRTTDGHSIWATADHLFLTPDGFKRLSQLAINDEIAFNKGKGRLVKPPRKQYGFVSRLYHHPHATNKKVYSKSRVGWRVPYHRLVVEASMNNMPVEKFIAIHREYAPTDIDYISPNLQVHHIDGDVTNNSLRNLQVLTASEHQSLESKNGRWANGADQIDWTKTLGVFDSRTEETYDLTMADGEPPNFVANDLVVHNSGKTLIGEMIRRELGTRGLYVCTSLSLQDQFAKDFPEAAILKGRKNYPTLDFPDDFDDPWAPITAADCDKHEGHCTYCSIIQACPYEQAKYTALKSSLVCTNTPYFLTEANGPARFSQRFPLIIIDEADKLESQLLNIIEVQVSGKLISDLDLPHPTYKTKPESWSEWALDIAPTIQAYGGKFRTDDPKQARRRVRFLRLAKRLIQVSSEITEGGWVYENWSNGTVIFKPIRVTRWADSLLWSHGSRFLLMSGTLIPAEIRASLDPPGPCVSYEAPSNFPPAQRPIRIVGIAPNDKASKDIALPKIALATKRIMQAHPSDRILIHTVSYATTNYLYDHLDKDRLLTYTSSSDREYILNRYKSQPNAVLLAPSMDRGIDLPDDLCRVIVVTKVPYPDLGDKQIQARLYEPGNRQQGQVWYATNTIRTLIQMLGRGMRHENDTCTHYILDEHFYKLSKQWGDLLIPRWIRDALVWGGHWKKDITEYVESEFASTKGVVYTPSNQ